MRKSTILSTILMGGLAQYAAAAPITAGVYWTAGGGAYHDPPFVPPSSPVFPPYPRIQPGDQVRFDVWIEIDPFFDPTGQGNGNMGLRGIAYNLRGHRSEDLGYVLDPMEDALSGFSYNGVARRVSDPYYDPSASTATTGYGGGWGFDTGGLPTGGDVTSEPGGILGATVEGAWSGLLVDVIPWRPGDQQNVRLGVGHGAYTAGDEDPVLGGRILGHPLGNSTFGDGHWIIQEGLIDTSGWAPGTYVFDIETTSLEVFDGALDYNVDHDSGFAIAVDVGGDVENGSFGFTIVPEPAVLGLVLTGALCLRRRSRPALMVNHQDTKTPGA